MCFITLISIKADHSWAQAIEVTPIIARMTYCMWTIFLVSLHMGDMETAIVRERHHDLERWHYEGNNSTFYSLCSLQHLASKIGFSTPSFPAFIWYDNENIWHSSFIMVHMFCSLVQELMHSVYEYFEKITFGEWRQIWGYITNDLTNMTSGYGFVSDFRNNRHYNCHYLLDLILDKC